TRNSPRKQVTNTVPDSEDDEIMLNAAIQLSRDEMSLVGTDAGPSSGKGRAANAEAIRRAEAAVRRIVEQSRHGFDVDDAAMDIDNGDGTSDVSSDDDDGGDTSDVSSDDEADEPLTKKGKGKAKAKGRAPVAKSTDNGNKFMTLAQAKREARRRRQEENESTKAEEKALRKKLGRKLTPSSETFGVTWKLKIKMVSPMKAEQPARIKLKLLAFPLGNLVLDALSKRKVFGQGGMPCNWSFPFF
ncbi:hypothetical protein MPER_02493, partial [Moniliophthora perniciosa FA553]